MLSTGQTGAGLIAMQRASNEWLDYWLPYFLLANYYLPTSPIVAAQWYQKGYQLAKADVLTQVPYLNNYAYVLAKFGCKNKANILIEQALALTPEAENLLDTKEQIKQSILLDTAYCQATNLN